MGGIAGDRDTGGEDVTTRVGVTEEVDGNTGDGDTEDVGGIVGDGDTEGEDVITRVGVIEDVDGNTGDGDTEGEDVVTRVGENEDVDGVSVDDNAIGEDDANFDHDVDSKDVSHNLIFLMNLFSKLMVFLFLLTFELFFIEISIFFMVLLLVRIFLDDIKASL